MVSLDVPEILIVLSLIGMAAWGYYNWTHPHSPFK
jgi:hypothetical protein